MTIYSWLCVAAMSVATCGGISAATKGDAPARSVRTLTTTTDKSFNLTQSSVPFDNGNKTADRSIRILPDVKYQPIDGFGGAITGSTAVNLLKMKDEDRKAFLKKTFCPKEGYGFSYVRVPIGCSDFSLSEYTCCDKKGIENFALTSEETDYIIPVLKEILAINPEVKIMASPWTAPIWMKVKDLDTKEPSQSWTGDYLNPDCYQDYATYFVKWIEAFKKNGIDIYSVTLQNEPLNRGNSASMFMGWEQQRDFLKTAVGPVFKKNGIKTKIYAFDHNYNYDNMKDQQGYPLKVYSDPEAAAYLSGAAYHNYGGNKDELKAIHEACPDMELVFSESTQGNWNDGSNFAAKFLGDMSDIALGTVNRWCRGAVIWNLMLDADRGPNRPGGCTTGFGAVDIDRDYKTIRYNSFYYIMAHMASVVAPGAVRVGSESDNEEDLTYAAFSNPDGTMALVVMNAGSKAKDVKVNDDKNEFTVPVPAKGVVSMKW